MRRYALTALLLLAGAIASRAQSLSLPANWSLPPVTRHPCLLFDAQDVPALRARLISEFGALDKIGDPKLAAYLVGDDAARRQSTAEFLTFWRTYTQRWREDNLDHPEWIDGVALRGIRRTLLWYDVVVTYGYLTPEQVRDYRDSMVRAIEYALGRDYRHPRITPNPSFRNMNIWTDIVCAAALVGLSFPELPQARSWIEFAVQEVNRQFDIGVWDGCWHESPRYHAAMLEITGMFFQVLKRRTGVNFFGDARYKAMLDWLVRFQTPRDKVAGATLGHPEGVVLLPGVGDSSWVAHSFGLDGMFAPQYAASDPHFAARLMWAWDRAGRPFDGDSVEWARVLVDPTIRPEPQVLGSDCSPGKGYVVMRSDFDQPDEMWFLLRCGNATRAGHDHADWNGFNLYGYHVPLALDAAAGAYSDPRHKAWHMQAVAHNTVVFGNRSQERRDGRILSWVTRPELDYSISDASAAAGVKKFVRHVLFVKSRYFVIWDEIDASEPAAWMFHTTATRFDWREHAVRCLTPWDAAVDLDVVWPRTRLQPGTRKGKYSDWKENQKQRDPLPFQYLDYFSVPNAPGQDFLVVLKPTRPTDGQLEVRDLGSAHHPVLEIRDGARVDRITLAPDSAEVRLGETSPILLHRTPPALR